eukprot:6174562-Pleurochrysis_carterae.AAC.5
MVRVVFAHNGRGNEIQSDGAKALAKLVVSSNSIRALRTDFSGASPAASLGFGQDGRNAL